MWPRRSNGLARGLWPSGGRYRTMRTGSPKGWRPSSRIRAQGQTTLREMASELNGRGVMTRRRGRRQVSNVRNLLRRVNNFE